jgi:2-phosphosulfolactate phosphatase
VQLEIDVALIPLQAQTWPDRVCIVVDVIRASSAIVTLLEDGVTRIIPVRSLDLARQLARPNGWVLAGESNGVAPPDFDYSNSPVELVQADLSGKVVVLATSNGTVVLDSLKDSPRVFVGCFLNAAACCRSAVSEARRLNLDIGIVCAGQFGEFVLDDAVCAGYLAEQCAELVRSQGDQPIVTDAAQAVERLYHSYPSILEAFLQSKSGRRVAEIGAGADNPFCSQVDTSHITPVLTLGSPTYLVPWHPLV